MFYELGNPIEVHIALDAQLLRRIGYGSLYLILDSPVQIFAQTADLDNIATLRVYLLVGSADLRLWEQEAADPCSDLLRLQLTMLKSLVRN